MAFPGFNNKKRSSIGGDFDRDGVKNRRDCQPMNWKKQGPEHEKWKSAKPLKNSNVHTQWKDEKGNAVSVGKLSDSKQNDDWKNKGYNQYVSLNKERTIQGFKNRKKAIEFAEEYMEEDM